MTTLVLSFWLCASAAPSPPPAPMSPLASARKLADALRYEEAVVEYQRYLGAAEGRPARERAEALFELAFIHLVLGDEVNAGARATEALELEPQLTLSPSAPARQVDFLAEVKQQSQRRAHLTVEPSDSAQVVKVRLVDPEKKVKRTLLRHALSANGPYEAVEMRCDDALCRGELPGAGGSFTAWYFVEALDSAGATLASAASAREPRELSVVATRSWYQSPLVWGLAGAALVAVGVVLYLLSPPPPR